MVTMKQNFLLNGIEIQLMLQNNFTIFVGNVPLPRPALRLVLIYRIHVIYIELNGTSLHARLKVAEHSLRALYRLCK